MCMCVVLVAFDIMFCTISCVTLQFAWVNLHCITFLTLCISLCYAITYVRFCFIMISLLYSTFCLHFYLFVMIALCISNLFSIRVGISFSLPLNGCYEIICGLTKELVVVQNNVWPYERIFGLTRESWPHIALRDKVCTRSEPGPWPGPDQVHFATLRYNSCTLCMLIILPIKSWSLHIANSNHFHNN